ncbi:MAG TPA: PAS domain S-box protein, partial [Methanothrix sp.]|nr:PAS domain S-box protein [Methanothrix sp.]
YPAAFSSNLPVSGWTLIKYIGRDPAREAGRFVVLSSNEDALKVFLAGFVTPALAYSSAARVAAKLTRAAETSSRKIGPQKVEYISRPVKGTHERPFQCENRIGILEAVGQFFTGQFAQVEHHECVHKGDEFCRYIITWSTTPAVKFKKIFYYSILFSLISMILMLYYASNAIAIPYLFLNMMMLLLLSIYKNHLEVQELKKNIINQSNNADRLFDESNSRYNDAMLVKEIGQGIAMILDTDDLLTYVMNALRNRLDFDRGMVLLANRDRTKLVFKAGYGYTPEHEQLLRSTTFSLNKPESRGVFVETFHKRTPFVINNIDDISVNLSARSHEYAKALGAHAFICVPIVFKDQALGILSVDNKISRPHLTESTLSLLSGIAQQIGISINNADSYRRLHESESKYRELVENANSIILRMDPSGVVTFFNEFAQTFFGYSHEEILGKNVLGTILPIEGELAQSFISAMEQMTVESNKYQHVRLQCIKRDGEAAWIAWQNKPVFDHEGRVREIMSIGQDITARRRAEEQLLESRMLLSQIVDQNSIPTIVIQKDHRVLYWNKASERLTGKRAADLVGTRQA